MFSFRRAVHPTSIAQTIGRIVRTPLARRVEEDERRNSVDVFLPHYDRAGVEKIIGYLQESGATAIDLVTSTELAGHADFAEVFSTDERLATALRQARG